MSIFTHHEKLQKNLCRYARNEVQWAHYLITITST
jgi:hypothetical protein